MYAYGGTPSEWFDLPVMFLQIFMEMIPKLQAQDMLNAITVGNVSSGYMSADDAKTVIRALENQRDGKIEMKEKPQMSSAKLAAMGIKVIRK